MIEVVTIREVEQLVQGGGVERAVEVREQHTVRTEARQGPPGPMGPAGTISFVGTAAQAVSGHRALRHTAAGLDYASSAVVDHAGRVVGISTAAAAALGTVPYQAAGRIDEPSWSWTPGGDIYLGLDGQLTQVVPAAADFLQRLGYAIDTTSMWVELSEPIIFE